jgi:hypothetical protein
MPERETAELTLEAATPMRSWVHDILVTTRRGGHVCVLGEQRSGGFASDPSIP